MKSNFRTKDIWNAHVEGTVCPLCGKEFPNNTFLARHINFTHNPEKKFINCEQCDYKTPIKDSMMRHIVNQHSAVTLVPCPICEKEVRKSSFRDHMKRHDPNQSELVKCKICGKDVKAIQLRSHRWMVHSKREYMCDSCSYRAPNNHNLRIHINKMHLGNKHLPRSQCEFCDVMTTNVSHHVKLCHPEKRENKIFDNPALLTKRYQKYFFFWT